MLYQYSCHNWLWYSLYKEISFWLLGKNEWTNFLPFTYWLSWSGINHIWSKKGKSVGPCSIPCDLLKMLNELISPLLMILINESFSTGTFPDKLKTAKLLHFTKKVQLMIQLIIDLFLSYLCSAKYLKRLCTNGFTTFLKLMTSYILCNSVFERNTLHSIH